MAMIVTDYGLQQDTNLTDYQSGSELLYPELLGPPIAANYDYLSIKTDPNQYANGGIVRTPPQIMETDLQVYSGQVIDAASGQPVPNATVIFLYQGGQIGEAVANSQGIFSIKSGIQPDIIRISSVGYKTFDFPFSQSSLFELVQDVKTMQDVTVTSTKSNKAWLLLLLIPLVLAQKKKGISTIGELKTTNVWPYLLIAAGILGWSIINKLLIKLGIFVSPEQKKVYEEISNPESAFSPSYWVNAPAGSRLITEANVQSYCYDIYHALGFWRDNFDTIFGIFQKLQTKSMVSYLADKFQQRYNVGLLGFLNDGNSTLSLPWDGLTGSHLKQLIDYVSLLPNYNT